MAEARRTHFWAIVAFVSVTGSLLGGSTAVDAGQLLCLDSSACGCDIQQQQLNCSPESGARGACIQGSCNCNPGWTGQFCTNAAGACCGVETGIAIGASNGAPCADATEAQCLQANGTYAGDFTTCASGVCDDTPTPTATATATPTATVTATQTRVPQGGDCTEPSECDPGLFCADLTCCDTACAGPDQACDVPGSVGTCITAPAGAPAASNLGLLIGLALLLAIAFAALRARKASR